MNWRAKIVRVRRRLFEANDSLGKAEAQRDSGGNQKREGRAKAVLIWLHKVIMPNANGQMAFCCASLDSQLRSDDGVRILP